MDNKIICTLLESGDIEIKNENAKQQIMLNSDKNILNASEIFKLFNYRVGCKYTIVSNKNPNIKNPSFEPIVSLLKEIANEINKIETNHIIDNEDSSI